MGKDKKTKKREQRERGVDSWVGVVCLCVCGVWLWRGGFLFFSFVLYRRERDRGDKCFANRVVVSGTCSQSL